MDNFIDSLDERRFFAAQNARDGLISVADLSLLTGVEASRLNGYAKKGFLTHYGEYHGKRLFNFAEIIGWAQAPGEMDEVRTLVRTTLETSMKAPNWPFSTERVDDVAEPGIRIVWKVAEKAA